MILNLQEKWIDEDMNDYSGIKAFYSSDLQVGESLIEDLDFSKTGFNLSSREKDGSAKAEFNFHFNPDINIGAIDRTLTS
jgi:hypothetical protein